jgi:predicted aconitase with swiveling domain
MIEFRGRVLLSGNGQGQAYVTKKVVSQLAAFEKSSENKGKKLLFADKSHADIYKKNLSGKIFVLPSFKASDINSMVILSAAKKKILPKCFLFLESLDPATVAAFSLAKAFLGSDIAVIDNLGEDFLRTVENADMISYNDSVVEINL